MPAITHQVRQILHGPRLQRKIVVAGEPYTPSDTYLDRQRKWYGDAMVEFVERMRDAPDEYVFDSRGQMNKEIELRYHAIRGMEEVHEGCCDYATGGGTGHLDPTYWDKQGPYQFSVKTDLPAGKEAADAVEAIFVKGAGTELECNSMMVAIQYRAMLKTLGEAEFNKKFPGGAGVFISPHHIAPSGSDRHPIWETGLFKKVTIFSTADLLPGDWVYFLNVEEYKYMHPGGAWQGEHALYLGGGMFRGFGSEELSEEAFNQELLDHYNTGLDPNLWKHLEDVPGLRNIVYRPVIAEIEK